MLFFGAVFEVIIQNLFLKADHTEYTINEILLVEGLSRLIIHLKDRCLRFFNT